MKYANAHAHANNNGTSIAFTGIMAMATTFSSFPARVRRFPVLLAAALLAAAEQRATVLG